MRLSKRFFSSRPFSGLLLSICCLSLAFPLISCGSSGREDLPSVCKTSVFSWEANYMTEANEQMLSDALQSLACEAVYQQVPDNTPDGVVIDYLKRRHTKEQDVYFLAGNADWGIEPDAESMKKVVHTVISWNAKAEKGTGFKGIVWDVEPYLLDEWEEAPEQCLDQFVENSILVYRLAREAGLSVIVCIPNFYDAVGLEAPLEQLIQEGCDAVAVMNYNKSDEAGQLEAEARLAKLHKKGLINITELQKPGYHKLTEKNTYYHDGLSAVRKSWEDIQIVYSDQALGFSWHYLKPALELLEKGR